MPYKVSISVQNATLDEIGFALLVVSAHLCAFKPKVNELLVALLKRTDVIFGVYPFFL
jgi:hypothetical protein